MQSFVNRPGPTSYYSSFSGLSFACSLSFAALQLLAITRRWKLQNSRRWVRILQGTSSFIYWIVLTVSGFACTIAYGFTPKPDAVGIQVLIFLTGLFGLLILILVPHVPNINTEQSGVTHYEAAANTPSNSKQQGIPKKRKCFYATGRYLNRFLKLIHTILSILFIIGGVNLAMTYKYQNP
jgi:hypothetical protein